MRFLAVSGLAAMLLAGVAVVRADDVTSGLQPGDKVSPFEVEKCGGAVNDGREVGATFCYRCMLGNRPVVMIFARTADEKLAKLVKDLDEQISQHADQKLASFVNLIGPDADALKATAKEFGGENKVENVALVVPKSNENGPPQFKISPEAEVTVMLYRGGEVKANHAVAGELTDEEIHHILDDVDKILN